MVLRSAAIDGRRMTAPHTMYLYNVFIPVTARGEHSGKLASGECQKCHLHHTLDRTFTQKTAENDVLACWERLNINLLECPPLVGSVGRRLMRLVIPELLGRG